MTEVAFDEEYTGGVLVKRVQRIVSAAEIERRDMPGQLKAALTVLATWQDDALDAAALTALTAAQRIARQAVIETRVATLSRIVRRLLIVQGLDQ